MTEAEWFAYDDARRLLPCLGPLRIGPRGDGRPIGRKPRLFACACVRHIWDHLIDARSRRAVEVAERLADGLATRSEVDEAIRDAHAVLRDADRRSAGPERGEAGAARAAVHTLGTELFDSPNFAVHFAALAYTGDVRAVTQDAVRYDADFPDRAAERRYHVEVLRDLAGNPFRPPPEFDLGWRHWQGGTLLRLAQGIYDRRRFADLPVLADALEEAGCTGAELLEHLRGPGPHALGCWALDLVLGKPDAVVRNGERRGVSPPVR